MTVMMMMMVTTMMLITIMLLLCVARRRVAPVRLLRGIASRGHRGVEKVAAAVVVVPACARPSSHNVFAASHQQRCIPL